MYATIDDRAAVCDSYSFEICLRDDIITQNGPRLLTSKDLFQHLTPIAGR